MAPVLLVAVFAAAVAVRLLVSQSLSPFPLWTNPQLDAQENLSWARSLAAGDFRWPSPPTHGPVYPYFLALLLHLSGGSLEAVRAAQAVLGGLTAVLVALLGARLFGRRAGLAAGLLLALYGPVALVDVALWEEVLILFLSVAALLLLVARRTAGAAGAAGVLLGLASAARPTGILFVAAAVLGILAVERGPRKLLPSAALVLGAALVVVPAVAVSSRAAGSFVFVRSYGAINLWMGNDPAGGGVQNARPNAAWDRLVGEPYRNGTARGEEERYFIKKSLARAASDPAGLARVLLSKAVWLTQAEEPRDNHSFAFFRGRSLPLRLLPGFGVLAGLSAVGFVAVLRNRPRPALPLLFVAAAALPALVALSGLRYRLPAVPILALFAGAGAIRLFEPGRARDLRALAPPALLATAVFALSHARTHAPSHVFAEELSLEAHSLLELGRLSEAEATVRRAMAADPGSGLPVEVLGKLKDKEGKTREARDLFARSLELAPDSRSARFFLARTEENLGNDASAREEYRKALEISPLFFPARFRLGLLLLRAGNAPAAANEFAAAASISPSEADPLLKLAEARRAERRWDDAVEAARKGARLAPDRLDAWLLLGSISAEAGDLPLLVEAVEKASAVGGREHPAVVLLVAKRQRLEGDRDGALVTLTGLVRRHPESALAAEAFLAVSREAGRESEARALLDALRSR